MGYMDLSGYYNLNFSLSKHHGYSLTEIENLYPYERDIYVTLLMNFIKEQQEEMNRKHG